MNRLYLFSGILLFFFAIAMAVYGISKGLMGFGWFIFPVIYGSGIFSAFVALLIIASMILVFLSFIQDDLNEARVDYGGAVLIGPIPIVFGSSGRTILITLVLLTLFIIFLIIILL
ncbi:MAG: DUF131 domain-containing protein [Thermoplasmata archaeon]|jgi:uncharacterized membrane protein